MDNTSPHHCRLLCATAVVASSADAFAKIQPLGPQEWKALVFGGSRGEAREEDEAAILNWGGVSQTHTRFRKPSALIVAFAASMHSLAVILQARKGNTQSISEILRKDCNCRPQRLQQRFSARTAVVGRCIQLQRLSTRTAAVGRDTQLQQRLSAGSAAVGRCIQLQQRFCAWTVAVGRSCRPQL